MDMHLPPSTALAALRIDGARLWQSLMDLAHIGATPKGGVCRIALTDLDRQGRDLFVQWARGAGCSIRVDAIGNIFARRAGADESLPPVMTGSHIDTQPTGGKFDGNYGVLAGLEVLRTLNAAGVRTRAPIEVAVWTNEEGSRFVPVMMGSGVYVGAFTLEHALAQCDAQGISVGQALQDIHYAGSADQGLRTLGPLSPYWSLSIEEQFYLGMSIVIGLAMLRVPDFALLIFGCGLIQAAHQYYYIFGTKLWIAATGMSSAMAGWLFALGVIAEAGLLMGFANWLERYRPATLMIAGGIGALLRWTLMAQDPGIPLLALLQLLHAASFALTFLGAMRGIQSMWGHQRTPTAQMMFMALATAPAQALASYASGLLYEDGWGARGYLAMAGFAAAGLVLVTVLWWRGRASGGQA